MGWTNFMNFEKFECVLSYALERVGAPEMKPKPEPVLAIQSVYDGKDVFVWLPTSLAGPPLRKGRVRQTSS